MKTELALLLVHAGPVIPAAAIAEMMRITERTLENRIYAKECPIPMFKIGNKWAAHVSDVACYIDAQRAVAQADVDAANGAAMTVLQTARKAA
jgi:hypothetical protein